MLSSNKNRHSPFFTFYKIGPEYITFRYDVNAACLKEIINKDGIIGPDKYKSDEEFFRNLQNWNDLYFCCDCNQELLKALRSDLELLATKYQMYGAYTLLGSIANDSEPDYFKKAAELGVKEGMVVYGVNLLRNGDTDLGRKWIEKGAELGNLRGMMNMGISFEYGTFTPIDYDKAAYFYKQAIQQHNYCFAYNNLGVMFAMANYLNTALSLFEKMNLILQKDNEQKEELDDFGKTEILDNVESCRQLLKFPIVERIKRAVVQHHSSKLEWFMCDDFRPVPSVVSDKEPRVQNWLPTYNDIYIVEDDHKEHQNINNELLIVSSPKAKFIADDFVFPIYSVDVQDGKILGSTSELVFLEKRVHTELNQYIQLHIGQLRENFQARGYIFVYLPAHEVRSDDYLITSFIGDEDIIDTYQAWNGGTWKTEQNYWKSIISEEKLPDDCAGFLHYRSNGKDAANPQAGYEYILFPSVAGTDWGRAFTALLKSIDVFFCNRITPLSEAMLQVDAKFNISVVGREGYIIIENIKMPVLSKVLYFFLLRHSEGIVLKLLSEHRSELEQWYEIISNRRDAKKYIDHLCNPTDNSINEKFSRIRRAFTLAFKEYDGGYDDFLPLGKKGEPYVVPLARSRILWQPKQISIFE